VCGPVDASIAPVDANGVDAFTCTPINPETSPVECATIGGPHSYWGVPGYYCMYVENSAGVNTASYVMSTPPSCQCLETYNCACFEATLGSDICRQNGTTLVSCSDGGFGPTIICK
jgi:hypothetical protein